MTYKVVFETNALVIVDLSNSECRSLQRVIYRPKRCPRRVTNSRSAMACDTVCLSIPR